MKKIKTSSGELFSGLASWWEDMGNYGEWYLYESIPIAAGCYQRGKSLLCYGHRIKCHDNPYEQYHVINGVIISNKE